MIIAKIIVTIAILIIYVLTMGMFTFSVDFPDGTNLHFEGWMF